MNYAKRALKDTNNKTRHIRNVMTNKTIRILDQDHAKKSDYQEEVNSGEEELANGILQINGLHHRFALKLTHIFNLTQIRGMI